jgi:hypothetical protein
MIWEIDSFAQIITHELERGKFFKCEATSPNPGFQPTVTGAVNKKMLR